MSWINLCSARYKRRKFLDNNEFEEDEISDDVLEAYPLLVDCLLLNDIESLTQNAKAIENHYLGLLGGSHHLDRSVDNIHYMGGLFSLSVIMPFLGYPDIGILRAIANDAKSNREECLYLIRLAKFIISKDTTN